MQTLADIHNQTARRQQQQSANVSRHTTIKPEIPSNYGCAGPCSQPPPDPSAGSRLQKRQVPEFFESGPHPTHITTILVTTAIVGALTLFAVATKR